jgi:hypothetical protein
LFEPDLSENRHSFVRSEPEDMLFWIVP